MGNLLSMLVYLVTAAAFVAVPVLAGRALRDRPQAARRWTGAGVSLGVLALAALVGEAYFRFVYDEPSSPGSYAAHNWYIRHDGDRAKFRGGAADRVRRGEAKEEDVPVVVLGDSYVWGEGVDPPQTFVSLLGADLGVDVLPAGIMGWSTANELAWLRQSKARPRVLVLSYVFNDILDATPRVHDATAARMARAMPERHREVPLVGQSYLFDWIVYRAVEGRSGGDYVACLTDAYSDEEALAAHVAELKAVAACCAERGTQLVVALWPQGAASFRPVEDRFVARARGALPGVPILTLAGPLAKAGLDDPVRFRAGPRDGHPGPAPHRLAADVLVPIVREALAKR